jgi:hypothetical protein
LVRIYDGIAEGSEALIAKCLYGVDGGGDFYPYRRRRKVIQ